jgi:uncharacterized pyridoxamine 5'-phosphate oxidase family protein
VKPSFQKKLTLSYRWYGKSSNFSFLAMQKKIIMPYTLSFLGITLAQNSEEARKLAWDSLKDCQVVFLATVDDGCPRVRPVTLMRKGNDLYTVSMLETGKVSQIQKNCNAEFAFSLPDMGFNAIRVECRAELVEDAKVRAEVYDSPQHALIRLIPIRFTVLMPPEFENVVTTAT